PLDAPSPPVERERPLPMKAVACQIQEVLPGVPSPDGASRKEQFQPPDRLAPRTARRSRGRCQSVHKRVALDPNDVSNPLFIKPPEPIVTDELPIHRQRLDLGGGDDPQEPFH